MVYRIMEIQLQIQYLRNTSQYKELITDSRILRGWHMAPHYSQARHPASLQDFITLYNQACWISIEEKIHLLLLLQTLHFQFFSLPPSENYFSLQIIPSADPSLLLVADILNQIISSGNRATSFSHLYIISTPYQCIPHKLHFTTPMPYHTVRIQVIV